MAARSPLIPRLAPDPEMMEAVISGHWTVPVDHLSPSSLSMLHRCPFQFQRRYVFGEKERPGDSLVSGSAVHSGLEYNFTQKIDSHEDLPAEILQEWFLDEGWKLTVDDQQTRSEMEVDWDVDEEAARQRATNMLLAYHREVAPRVEPLSVEGWVEADFGIVPKVIGRFDVETQHRLIDHKTGKQLTTKPKPDWRIQAGCYQQITGKPVEFHSISSSKPKADATGRVKPGRVSIATPATHPDLDVKLSPSQHANVKSIVVGLAALAQHYMDTYGAMDPWPTTGWMHTWACDYCGWRKICPAWSEL